MNVEPPFPLRTGAPAPDFDLPGTDGKRHTLAEFDASPVLVVAMWCNHCPYVRAWEDRAIALARATMPRGAAFVAINANDTANYPTDDLPHMAARADEKRYPFPYVLDESQRVARAYGGAVTPQFFVFDRDRKLAYQGRLDDNRDAPGAVTRHELADAVEALLAERRPAVAETVASGCSVKWK
ncbi:MAG: thioredoxin family protein [Thermoplasmatota archaeon]